MPDPPAVHHETFAVRISVVGGVEVNMIVVDANLGIAQTDTDHDGIATIFVCLGSGVGR
jgi:hypothetical protein